MYLRYFIAIVTVHVTSASFQPASVDTTEIRDCDSSTVEFEQDVPIDIVMGCMQKKLNLPDHRVLENLETDVINLLEKYAIYAPIKNATFNRTSLTQTPRQRYIPKYKKKLAHAINTFTPKLFQAYSSLNRERHYAMSPLIVHASVVLVYPVLKRYLKEEVDKGLGHPMEENRYDLTRYKTFIDSMNRIDSSIFNMKFTYFNSLNPSFASELTNPGREIFGASFESFDCIPNENCEERYDKIYDWIMNETRTPTELLEKNYLSQLQHRKAVEDFAGHIGHLTGVLLVSASYFRGTLKGRFRSEVNTATFLYGDLGKETKSQYYYGEGIYRHGELPELDAKFIELPLKKVGKSPALSLFVIHPNKIGDPGGSQGCAHALWNFHRVDIGKLLNGTSSRVKTRIPELYFLSDLRLGYDLHTVTGDALIFDSKAFENYALDDAHITPYQSNYVQILPDSEPGPEENLEPWGSNDTFVDFNVNSSFIYVIVLMEPVPVYLFVGRSL